MRSDGPKLWSDLEGCVRVLDELTVVCFVNIDKCVRESEYVCVCGVVRIYVMR